MATDFQNPYKINHIELLVFSWKYLFTTLPDNVEITVDFPNFPSETQTEEIPSALTGSFIFNLGFGFAF